MSMFKQQFGVLTVLTVVVGLGTMFFDNARAATSETISKPAVSARLITVQDGVAGGMSTLSAGIQIELNKGWKTYWRSPGEVGIPPQVDWSASQNVKNVRFEWPAPERFTAFGIENFGYKGEVVFPLQINLERPGEATLLSANVSLLVCSDVCVPETLHLSLLLSPGTGIDRVSGSLIAKYADKIPLEGAETSITEAAAFLDENRTELVINLVATELFQDPDVFPELGSGIALGKPDIRLGDGKKRLWARFPVLSFEETAFRHTSLTITDGQERAVTVSPKMVSAVPAPPFSMAALAPGVDEVAWIALIAFIGGLILNVMPCVLPVLSIKLSSALKHQGRNMQSVRGGFLAAAFGVMIFVWGLAGALFALQRMGIAVGWGLQFQNPVFLAFMQSYLSFHRQSVWSIRNLASNLHTKLALYQRDGRGYWADFLTGLFGAVLATPCSAPFLGTAVAFALAGRGLDILIVFTSLGLGLAVPYLVVAALPGLVNVLPKPGRWMVYLKFLLGLMLGGTVLWLLLVLKGVAGFPASVAVWLFATALVFVLSWRRSAFWIRLIAGGTLASLALAAPVALSQAQQKAPHELPALKWVQFDRGEIARLVSRGQVVFVDVTADWCITCKANKALVIERDPVLSALGTENVTAMQADWTRPDEGISRYLASFGRFGIPFNAVYGPSAPQGIVLSELLTSSEIIDALRIAKGSSIGFNLRQNERSNSK